MVMHSEGAGYGPHHVRIVQISVITRTAHRESFTTRGTGYNVLIVRTAQNHIRHLDPDAKVKFTGLTPNSQVDPAV